MDRDAFARFAADRLGAAVYDSGTGAEEDGIFAASLASAQEHMQWTRHAVDANGGSLTIVPGYLDRMTPNALADRVGAVHFIGFHQALLVTIVEFALFAFTQREVFPDIGNARGEGSPAPAGGRAPGLMLLEKTLAGGVVVPKADTYRVPKDPDRHVAAIYLALLMARFVWLHELAHCFHGHVGLVQADGIALRFYEVPEAPPLVSFARSDVDAADRTRLLRALELEADGTALHGCCRIQLDGMENIDGIKAMDADTRLGLVIFGAYAMTWLFEEYQRFMNSRRGMTHPAPYDRLKHIMRIATGEIGPSLPGFTQVHDGVTAHFNAMRRAIPDLHALDFDAGDAPATPSLAERAAVQAMLVPHAFDIVSR